jgi:hypothetical protein
MSNFAESGGGLFLLLTVRNFTVWAITQTLSKWGNNGRFSRFQGPLRGPFLCVLRHPDQVLRHPDRGRGLVTRKHLGAHARRCSPTVSVEDRVDSGRPGAVVARSFVKMALHTAEGCLQKKSASKSPTKRLAAPLPRLRHAALSRNRPEHAPGATREADLGSLGRCVAPFINVSIR